MSQNGAQMHQPKKELKVHECHYVYSVAMLLGTILGAISWEDDILDEHWAHGVVLWHHDATEIHTAPKRVGAATAPQRCHPRPPLQAASRCCTIASQC